MKLIVNADDYGWTEEAVAATRKCIQDEIVSNTTAMITMPYFEHAFALAEKDGFVDRIGLHLNLSAGTPLTDGIKRSPIFCDKDGNFNSAIRRNRLYRFWLPSTVKPLIAEEIRAQMRLFFKLGLTERHYDSHGQVCVYCPILPIALACAREFGFMTTRMFINMSANSHCAKLSLPRKGYIHHIDKAILRAGLKKTTHLGNSWDFPRMIDSLPQDSVIELMVHPQYRRPNLELSLDGDLMDWKRPFCQSFAPIVALKNRVDIISFKQLAED